MIPIQPNLTADTSNINKLGLQYVKLIILDNTYKIMFEFELPDLQLRNQHLL